MDKLMLENALQRGITFLKQYQYPNGQFRSFTASDDEMLVNCTPDSSVFSTALIAYSLSFVTSQPLAGELVNRSADFLTREMKQGGAWQHYTQYHAYHTLVPADLDDTCCVSLVLEKCGNTWIRNHNTSLITSNRNLQGLFYTWLTFRLKLNRNSSYLRLVLPELWRPIRSYFFWKQMECDRYDVDGAVNANVLFYLGHNDTTAPIVSFLNTIIRNHKEADCDKWYRNTFTIYYFISRNFGAGIRGLEPSRQPIVERILKTASSNGRLGTSVLDTALGVCTLLNLSAPVDILRGAVNFLLDSQLQSGGWERRIVYYGGPKKLIGWGSEELTTAFCLEALAKFKDYSDHHNK